MAPCGGALSQRTIQPLLSHCRSAAPISLRYPLVAGQGNFGSIDGDMNCDGFVTVGDIGGFVLALTNARVLVIALARFGGDGSRLLAAFPLDKTLGIQLSTMRRAPVVTVTGANKPFSGIVYSPEAAAAVSAMIDELRRR